MANTKGLGDTFIGRISSNQESNYGSNQDTVLQKGSQLALRDANDYFVGNKSIER